MTVRSDAEKKNKQALNARRVYLRMRVDEFKSEIASNLEEFRVIMAALPKAAAGSEKRTMKMRAEYRRSRNPALMEERAALIAEGKTPGGR